MNDWICRPTPFKFQLSDLTFFSVSLLLQVRSENLINQTLPVEIPTFPVDELMPGSQGFLIRGLPIMKELQAISRLGEYLCYVPLHYQHCYIDLRISFEDYLKKFSTKTRSTINRKIKKYAEHCGGTISWKTYKSPNEMREFFRHARLVSKLTYQEKLLNAGIPDSEDFIVQAESLAADQCVRAYILFDDDRPVSYLYCPVYDGVLIYSYLGYDPDYMHLSVGTVLQWLAVKELFDEACFKYFDFTEGQSDHKRLFATHQQLCANVFLVNRTVVNTLILYSHLMMNRFSKLLGNFLYRFGLKAKIRKLLRFAI